MKKLLLWLLIFIQPLIFSVGCGGLALLLYLWINTPDGSDARYYDFSTPLISIICCLLLGFVMGILLSILIYRRYLSTQRADD